MALLKLVAPLNIDLEVVTSSTLIVDTSWLKLVAPSNIFSIVVTLAVFVKIGRLKLVASRNIENIFVTLFRRCEDGTVKGRAAIEHRIHCRHLADVHEEMSWLKLVASWNMVAIFCTPGIFQPEMSSLKAW